MSSSILGDESVSDRDEDKDFEDDEVDEPSEEAGVQAPGGFKLVKNYMTPFGAKKIRDELDQLLNKERPKLVETIAWAASNGDRSENADYIYGKRRLREIDKRVRFLHKRLDIAEVIDPEKQNASKVLFGASVSVQNENGETREYKIVGIDESDAKNHCISWNSPIGKALLQASVGDFVIVKTPKGDDELEILKIEYKKIF